MNTDAERRGRGKGSPAWNPKAFAVAIEYFDGREAELTILCRTASQALQTARLRKGVAKARVTGEMSREMYLLGKTKPGHRKGGPPS